MSALKKDKFKHLQSKVQLELRKMQDLWWQRKAEEIQHYADTHNTRKFFNALKMVYGPSQSGCSPLLTSDGSNLIKDQAGLRDRWAEYFSNLLNLPSTIDPVALNQIPQQPIMDELDALPTLDEIKKAISQLNTNRASGKDGIPAEIYKAASPNTLESFHTGYYAMCSVRLTGLIKSCYCY